VANQGLDRRFLPIIYCFSFANIESPQAVGDAKSLHICFQLNSIVYKGREGKERGMLGSEISKKYVRGRCTQNQQHLFGQIENICAPVPSKFGVWTREGGVEQVCYANIRTSLLPIPKAIKIIMCEAIFVVC
jgi:hypothetical protein